MRPPLSVFPYIVVALAVLCSNGCTLFQQKSRHAVPSPSPAKIVVTPRVSPKSATKIGPKAPDPEATQPQATLLSTDAESYGVMVVPMGSYRGNRLIYFVECTNYQKVPVEFGTENITVTDGRGTQIPIHIPNNNIFRKIRNLWFRYPDYQKQLLWPSFTIEPQLSYGGLVIVDAAPITNFSFDFAGQQCSVSFSVK